MAKETQLLKGVLDGCVLMLLSQQVSYGYEVVQRLRESGFEEMSEATVYPILTRLNNRGLLSAEKRPSEIGPTRKYYALTSQGQQALDEFRETWASLSTSVVRILAL